MLFASIASGCNVQEDTSMVDGRGHVEQIEEKYEVDPGGTLTVDADLGSISVEP